MNNRYRLFVAFLVLMALLSGTMTMAQKKQFTLEDLNYGGKNYRQMTPRSAYYAWWGDELVRTEQQKCVLINKKNKEETILFTLRDVNKVFANQNDPILRTDYAEFPYPGQPVVKLLNSNETILFDWKNQKVLMRQRGGYDGGDWCAASRASAFNSDNQLYVVDCDGKEHQLTHDGSREIVYGKSVHRDEFGIYKGTFWSPDGSRLAFYRMDQSMVTDYPQVNTSTRISTEEPDKYPMAGETSHQVTVGVYDMATEKIIYLQAGDPTDRYFTNIQWGPDSKTIYIFELNRDQTDIELVSYDATTGARKGVLYHEHNDKYAEPLNPITFLPWDQNKFIIQSQKDGYNHLYLHDTSGKELRQLTKGEWVVLDLVGFNKSRKSAIILSTEASPIQNNLYEVNLGNGKRTLLDSGTGCHGNVYEESGHHDKILSSSGNFIYDDFSDPNTPRELDILDVAKHKRTTLTTCEDPWKDYDVPEFSCGTIKAADGTTDLYYRMVKPVGFNPQKKYPTVIYVYGGPHSRNVEASWHYMSRGWETYMAQKGYLIFVLDNRGSCDRGLAFEQATFRQLGQIEMADQMKGVEYLKSLPYVDTNRIGVHGWSFGGFMTISLMTNYPEVFKVGVAGGPVIDWKWYEVMYGERYMDTPQTNPNGYKKTSLLNQAKNLRGKLQIIQGMNDTTVVPQHCLEFINACISAGTQPDFFVYPGEPHNMRGHKSVHLHERITQYFEDYLK